MNLGDFQRGLLRLQDNAPAEHVHPTSFALYALAESHAASFALIAYASAYPETHYLAAFTVCILNNQPMGFYSPATLVTDAKRYGQRFRPVDVTRSQCGCSIETEGNVRYVRLTPFNTATPSKAIIT